MTIILIKFLQSTQRYLQLHLGHYSIRFRKVARMFWKISNISQ